MGFMYWVNFAAGSSGTSKLCDVAIWHGNGQSNTINFAVFTSSKFGKNEWIWRNNVVLLQAEAVFCLKQLTQLCNTFSDKFRVVSCFYSYEDTVNPVLFDVSLKE